MAMLRLVVLLQCFVRLISSSNDCQPVTWNDKRSTNEAVVGDINCRYTTKTGSEVNYFTCSEIAQRYRTTFDILLDLNPSLGSNCQNIKPNTDYCVDGFLEPLRAWDGNCGLPHDNATCLGTPKQCCSGKTFTCGNTEDDCATGVCYSGACLSALQFGYSLDGKCGPKHGNTICGGIWGDCCNNDGVCGSNDDYCSKSNCFSGNCTQQTFSLWAAPAPGVAVSAPWQTGSTPNGTCGGSNHYTCDVVYGSCCSADGLCGSTDQCDTGCQTRYGKCNNGSAVVFFEDYGHF